MKTQFLASGMCNDRIGSDSVERPRSARPRSIGRWLLIRRKAPAFSMGRLTAVLAIASVVLLTASPAHAYTWMVRHGYAGCNQCHADPSGGGLLTQYGRAQGELLLRSRYGSTLDEPGKVADFMFGAIPIPDSLLLGGDLRSLELWTFPDRGPSMNRFVWMQSDLQGQITVGRARANASIGYSHGGAFPASLTHGQNDNVVSRVHWLGVDIGPDGNWLVRAGRMNLPFGVRFVEHNLAVRRITNTNINDQQQHGVSVAYNGNGIRGEVMAVLGNFQLRPDMYRSRGGVGYVEVMAGERLGIGISSLILHADRDLFLSSPAWRQAHALSVRYSPTLSLVLLAEADIVFQSKPNGVNDTGYGNVVQADWEVVQGVHLALAGESVNVTPSKTAATYSVWATANWFFAPHADVRLDLIQQSVGAGTERSNATSVIAQMHLFL